MNQMLCVAVFAALLPLLCVAAPRETPSLSLPQAYTAVGRVIMPYGDILEPFNVSVDMKANTAMYSFYNGTILTCALS